MSGLNREKLFCCRCGALLDIYPLLLVCWICTPVTSCDLWHCHNHSAVDCSVEWLRFGLIRSDIYTQQITTLFVSLAATEIDNRQKGTRELPTSTDVMQESGSAHTCRLVRMTCLHESVWMTNEGLGHLVTRCQNRHAHTPQVFANLLCRLIIQAIFGENFDS